MTKLILHAQDFDNCLTDQDIQNIKYMDDKYSEAMEIFKKFPNQELLQKDAKVTENLISIFSEMGSHMEEMFKNEPNIHIYSFKTPNFLHGEVSRVIAKLRNMDTHRPEFVYYIQRAYELLFNLAFGGESHTKHHILVNTPVSFPTNNIAVHKIPNTDEITKDSVMCVMLRAALLPSMIVSKEIQEYSTHNHITPFALFKIGRDDTKNEKDMAYILDLEKSYYDLKTLDGKDWFFADPMNATGGSIITVVKFLLDQGVKPKSIQFLNVLSSLKGSLRIVRSFENAKIFTLWMDPALNEKAYILPGIGDAGDRINGSDSGPNPRNIIQLIADYGSNIISLYRSQVREIEKTVLGK
jgi:uracil phosphoribosyltransferase